MEFIGSIIGIIIVVFIYGFVIELIGAGTRAAGRSIKKAVTGKETYFGPAQIKIEDHMDERSGLWVKKIMFRGAFPNTRPMELTFALSAFDSTDGTGNWRPLLSFAEVAQEPETICYQVTGEFGLIQTGMAMTDWVQLGVIVPDLVQAPVSGLRKVSIFLRVFNSDDPPHIYAGQAPTDEGDVVLTRIAEFEHNFQEAGYEEEKELREEAQQISLQIGIAIAMADGSLGDDEGEVLRSWIIKEVSPFSEGEQTRLKAIYNGALKEGFEKASNGTLSVSRLVDRLSEINDKKAKYEAVELALDVMAADGVADPAEMKLIRNVARSLDLDMDEVERMREGVTLNLSGAIEAISNVESLVGIEESWTADQKRKHLRLEFQKWSNRLNSLPEGADRESAQNMLNSIAELRKKYG